MPDRIIHVTLTQSEADKLAALTGTTTPSTGLGRVHSELRSAGASPEGLRLIGVGVSGAEPKHVYSIRVERAECPTATAYTGCCKPTS